MCSYHCPRICRHNPTLWWGFLSGELLVYFFIFVGATESGEPAVVPVSLLLADARSGIDL